MIAEHYALLLLCLALFVEGLHTFVDNRFSALAMALAVTVAALVLTGALA